MSKKAAKRRRIKGAKDGTVYLPDSAESANKLGDWGKPIELEMLLLDAMFTVVWAIRPMGCTKGQTFMYLRCSNSDLWESKRIVIARHKDDIVSNLVATPILKPGDIVSIRLNSVTQKKQVVLLKFCGTE